MGEGTTVYRGGGGRYRGRGSKISTARKEGRRQQRLEGGNKKGGEKP